MAEQSSAIGSATANGKLLHQVFLKKDADASKVLDLIKSAVGHDYISSWSDGDDGSISAKFKAMPSQIEMLKEHKDVVRVMKVELPIQDVTIPEGRRRFSEINYCIRPINLENAEQCNATGAILKTILEDVVRESTGMDGMLRKWTAKMTDEQVAKVESLDGVKAVPLYRSLKVDVRSKWSIGNPASISWTSQIQTMVYSNAIKSP